MNKYSSNQPHLKLSSPIHNLNKQQSKHYFDDIVQKTQRAALSNNIQLHFRQSKKALKQNNLLNSNTKEPNKNTKVSQKKISPLLAINTANSCSPRYGMNSPKIQQFIPANPGFTQLKDKINDLAGRLQQIKKDYEKAQGHKKKRKTEELYKNQNCKKNIVGLSQDSKNRSGIASQAKLQKKQEKSKQKIPNAMIKSKVNFSKDKKSKQLEVNPLNPVNEKLKKTSKILSQSSNNLKLAHYLKSPNIKNQEQHINLEKQLIRNELIRNDQKEKQSQNCKNPTQKTNNSQENPNSHEKQLLQYVTSFKNSPTTIKQSISDSNLIINLNKSPLLKKQSMNQEYYLSSILKAFTNDNPTSFQQLCRNHLNYSIDVFKIIKNRGIAQKVLRKELKPTKLLKPLQKNKPTIVFDLDQTLIHCNQNIKIPCDIILPIHFPNDHMVKAGINVRPYAQQCLKQLSTCFQIIIFTASHECYANVIIDYLDPKKEYVSARYFREDCYRTQLGFYVKDLRVIDRPLKNLLLIDNAAYSYGFQPENGVPIIPFYDNKADLELKNLIKYLKEFTKDDDVRIRNRKIMKFDQYHYFNNSKDLINQLYL